MKVDDIKCEIYQHGELYNCRVYVYEGDDDISLGCIRCDKVKITYNTNRKLFTVNFIYGQMRLVETHVGHIYCYDLTKNHKIQLPSYDIEWPYDNIVLEMAEESGNGK